MFCLNYGVHYTLKGVRGQGGNNTEHGYVAMNKGEERPPNTSPNASNRSEASTYYGTAFFDGKILKEEMLFSTPP